MNTETKITGTYNRQQSWERQSVWDLENGWQATVGQSHYGEHITRLDSPDRKFYWHCSNGDSELPDFARPWGKLVAHTNLIQIGFEKVF